MKEVGNRPWTRWSKSLKQRLVSQLTSVVCIDARGQENMEGAMLYHNFKQQWLSFLQHNLEIWEQVDPVYAVIDTSALGSYAQCATESSSDSSVTAGPLAGVAESRMVYSFTGANGLALSLQFAGHIQSQCPGLRVHILDTGANAALIV
eukprot:m51a1_g5262 hypothetical protein (149) ;mRNA; f:113581-114166